MAVYGGAELPSLTSREPSRLRPLPAGVGADLIRAFVVSAALSLGRPRVVSSTTDRQPGSLSSRATGLLTQRGGCDRGQRPP